MKMNLLNIVKVDSTLYIHEANGNPMSWLPKVKNIFWDLFIIDNSYIYEVTIVCYKEAYIYCISL